MAPIGIPVDHLRLLMRRKTIEQLPQSGWHMFGRMGIPGLHLYRQNQPQIGRYVAMKAVCDGRLVRIGTRHRSFLMAVERLYGRVAIKIYGSDRSDRVQ